MEQNPFPHFYEYMKEGNITLDSNMNITSEKSRKEGTNMTSNQLLNATKSNQGHSQGFKSKNINITSNELVKEAHNTTGAAHIQLRNATNQSK